MLKIPKAIKEKGELAIYGFRTWFKSDMMKFFLSERYDVIIEAIRLKYTVDVTRNDFVKRANSDVIEFQNYDSGDIENQIDDLIRKAGKYYNEYRHILSRYSTCTFLAYRDAIIEDNETGLDDSELKIFLKNYNETYKTPVKKLLQEWYRLNYNPGFEFNGAILDALNFSPCGCYTDDDGGQGP